MTKPTEEYINGQVLMSFRDFIKKKFGKEGINQINRALTFDITQIIDEGEYPVNYAVACMDYIQKTYGPHELFQAGRFSLANVGAKRYFTLFLPPQKLLAKLEESVPKVNNSVKLRVEYLENGAVVTLSNPNLMDVQCKYWHGMLQGIYDLTKTKGTIDVDTSRIGKDKKAIFTMKW